MIIRLQNPIDKQLYQYYEFDPENRSSMLGKGGMGVVFKGKLTHNDTGRSEDVAIKVLFKDLSEESVMRARREASIQITHENIVRMYGFVETTDQDGQPKYHVVSEYLDGEPLSEILKRQGSFSIDKALAITKHILSALLMLHNKGYVHRDIDPSNIMVCKDGKIKLIDFGIAKNLNESQEEAKNCTIGGKFIGKVNYASPEQVRGEHWLTNQKSDIYSVGILLYELIYGRLPFQGTTHQIMTGHLQEPIVFDNAIPKDIKYIITKATSKKQENRYQTAAEFIVDIEKIEKGQHVGLKSKKWRSIVIIILSIIVLMATIVFYFYDKDIKYRDNYTQGVKNLSISNYQKALEYFNVSASYKQSDSVNNMIAMVGILNNAVNSYNNSDYQMADSLFVSALHYNSSDAYYYLGEMFLEGIGVYKDVNNGIDYLQKAANAGNGLAYYRLGVINKNGIYVNKDLNKAAVYFDKAMRIIDFGADNNNPEMQCIKGSMYREGNGVEKNIDRAITYYKNAADNNYAPAQNELYEILKTSDYDSAYKWLEKSAQLNYPKSQYRLGAILFRQGDYSASYHWTKSAADHDYSPALRQMGAIYEHSDASKMRQNLGIEKNEYIAHEYYERAVAFDQDNYIATFDLAIAYRDGVGCEINNDKALQYFQITLNTINKLPSPINEIQHPNANKIIKDSTDGLNRIKKVQKHNF